MGEISDNKMKKYKKGEAVLGDYQCGYCNHRTLCFGNKPEARDSWPTDEQIVTSIKSGNIVPIEQELGDEGWV